MKRQTLFLIVLTLLVSICGIASAITEDEFLWSNMNNDPVRNGTPYYLDLVMEEEEPIQLERITTYHWNNGEGAEPGTVSIYLGDALLSSWPAVGRSAYGTENAYWDAAVNIILMPGYTYSFRLSDEDSWSYNAASDNCGMIELYGHRLFDFNTNKGQTDGSQDQCAVPDPGIEVILNNKSLVMLDEKGMPTGPIVLNKTVYIPAPAVTQIMGMDISFDSTTNQVIVMPPQNINIVMNNQTINNTTVNDNSSGPVIINNTVYIPAPTVTQITGMDISFDSTTNQVIIMPAEEIKIVVNNETFSSTVINNNSFGPVIINDHVLLPIETVAEITGHKVDWDQNNHVLNITDPAETPAHGEEPISGYVWVLDRKEVEVSGMRPYPEMYIYSYEGEKDGKEWMLFKFRYQSGDQYCHGDVYFGCDVPPAAIKAGGDLSMEMVTKVENFGYHNTGSGWSSFWVDPSYIRGAEFDDYLKDENGDWELYLNSKESYADKNEEKHLTVNGTVADSETAIGDEMRIKFHCHAGNIYWYYKLQYIDNEADQDNNGLTVTDNTDTVPAETPARGYWKLTETTPYKMEDEYITANTKNHYGYDVINGGVRYTYDVTSGGTSDKDYYHFTAYGEVSDPPETGYPGEKLTMDLHCWVDPGSLEGSGNFSTYSSLYMGYCHNYLANWDYAEYACGNPWTNVNYDGTNENKTSFSSGDGYPAYTRMNESGQVCMIFPEGESGDILEIESLLHIGDRHPLTTTWKYVFVEENQMTAG